MHQVSPACRGRFRSGGQEKETLFGAKLDLAGQTHEVGAEDGFDMADLVRSLVVVEDHEVGVADRDRSDLHGVGRGESQMISRSWRLANSAETKLAPLQPVSKMKRSVRPPIVMSV